MKTLLRLLQDEKLRNLSGSKTGSSKVLWVIESFKYLNVFVFLLEPLSHKKKKKNLCCRENKLSLRKRN